MTLRTREISEETAEVANEAIGAVLIDPRLSAEEKIEQIIGILDIAQGGRNV